MYSAKILNKFATFCAYILPSKQGSSQMINLPWIAYQTKTVRSYHDWSDTKHTTRLEQVDP